jgi:hypothetical protein
MKKIKLAINSFFNGKPWTYHAVKWILLEAIAIFIAIPFYVSFCRGKEFVFQLTVVDSLTNTPLSDKNIWISGYGDGKTDKNGIFYVDDFKTRKPKISWWPGCNCVDEFPINITVATTDINQTNTVLSLDLSAQKSDTIYEKIYIHQ